MTVTLPLQPQEEARLVALAHAKGVSTDALVRQALEKILAAAPELPVEATPDSPPIWDMILANMKDVPAEAFARLPNDGASESLSLRTSETLLMNTVFADTFY